MKQETSDSGTILNPEDEKMFQTYGQIPTNPEALESFPESKNIEDRRGETYGGWRDVWRRLQEPFDPRRDLRVPGYQRGGVVREPTHVSSNRANLRMIAHHARRDPARAKHLLQGLRRQHNGLRAI